jgi:SP family myo-inositol transporter-like MFS transporter 13
MTSPLLVGEVSQGDAKHTSPVWTPGTIRALVVACGVMASQQLCGFNSLMYYSATLFEDLGFADPVAIALVVALTNFVFTFVAVKYVDIVGRRDMLLQTMPLMELALFGLVYVFGGDPPSGKSIVVLIVCYVACYSSALGNVPWQGVELLPLPARALGSTAITATNWACNFLVSSTFLTLTEVVSAQGAFLIYSVFTALACVGVYFCYPDVSGLPLEAVQGIFDNGFIIRRT